MRVSQALENNPDLKATALRLKASELLLSRTRSSMMPSTSARFNRSRDNQGLDALTGKTTRQNHYQVSVNIGWELDIWGKLADEYRADQARHDIQHMEMIGAYDSLSARVIQTWILIAGTQDALILAEEKVGILESVESFIMQRYRDGLGRLDELSTARTRTLVARSRISRLKEKKAGALRELQVLSGRFPGTADMADCRLPEISMPGFSAPVSILKNRPDIKAALYRLDAATLAALAAKKKMLPSLSLRYELGKRGTSFSLLRSGDALWNIMAGMVQPIFEGGRLLNEARAARLESDASVESLRASVLNALKEVEDKAGIEKELQTREDLLCHALKESKKSTSYYEDRYRKGLATLLDLMVAIEQEMNIKSDLIETRTSRMTNRIGLALALGVGA